MRWLAAVRQLIRNNVQFDGPVVAVATSTGLKEVDGDSYAVPTLQAPTWDDLSGLPEISVRIEFLTGNWRAYRTIRTVPRFNGADRAT